MKSVEKTILDAKAKLFRYAALYHTEHLLEPEELEQVINLKPGMIHLAFASISHTFYIHDRGKQYDEQIKKFTKRCKQEGIITIVYICLFTIEKRYFEEHPEAKEWLTRDIHGNSMPQACYDTEIRYQGCVNNPGWQEHIREVTKCALELGFTGVFYDNPVWFKCHCEKCQESFRKYRRERGKDETPIPIDPNWEDENWIDYTIFVSESVGKFIKDLSEFGKSIDPNFIVCVNTSPPTYLPPSTRILHSPQVTKYVDFILYELGTSAPKSKSFGVNGIQLEWGNVDHYSYGQAEAKDKVLTVIPYHSNRVLDRLRPNLSNLGLAEGLAFRSVNICPELMFLTRFKQVKKLKPYFGFIERYSSYFTDSKLIGDVALLFSWETLLRYISPLQRKLLSPEFTWIYPGITNNGYPSYKAFCYFLAHQHITFKTVLNLEEGLDTNMLVLPDVAYLSEKEVINLKQMVKDGLNLLITGEGLLQESKGKEVIQDLLGSDYLKKTIIQKSYGKGRIVYSPLRLELEYIKNKSYSPSGDKLISIFDWLSKNYSVAAKAPSEILITTLKHKNKLLINIVNYNVNEDDKVNPIHDIAVTINKKVNNVKLLTPDNVSTNIKVKDKGAKTEIIIPETYIYNLLVGELRQRSKGKGVKE